MKTDAAQQFFNHPIRQIPISNSNENRKLPPKFVEGKLIILINNFTDEINVRFYVKNYYLCGMKSSCLMDAHGMIH